MPEIHLPKAEFQQGEININLKDYLPKRENKNLANLSDEELANLSPEELEEAKKARENLLAIKKAGKEVGNMDNQEKWAQEVQKFAQEHNVTIEEAERVLKERLGLGKPSELATFFELMKPKPSPIEEAISKAVAARAEQIANALFPAPGTPPGANVGAASGGQPKNLLTGALQEAKQAGVQSLYLPDGTVVYLGEGKDQGSILKKAEEQINDYVTKTVTERLPALFSPPGGGKPAPLIGDNVNPEVARLVYEDKWKEEERKAEDVRSQARDDTIRGIAAMVGAGLSPEGFKKVQKLLKEGIGPPGEKAASAEEGETTPKLLKATCWKCLKLYPYEEDETPVCPYCGTPRNVQCPKCDAIFTPTNSEKMVCPQCGAELMQAKAEAKEEEHKEKSPEAELPLPPIVVGGGLLE